jgi:hypothetical protein
MEAETVDLRKIRISVVSHIVLAILVGWISIYIQVATRTLFAAGAGLVILILFGYLLERGIGKQGIKWWLGNGAIIYLFIWLISWAFFLNL